jgi:CDP-glycerol glycerophosphotransferase
MSSQQRLAAFARRVFHRLPSPVQSRLRRLRLRAARVPPQQPAMPVLSVVVVATDAESYLNECLRSLRSQTIKRFEVLVVDNGSTDATAAVAEQAGDADPRFRVIKRPRLGVAASRNAGAQLARGAFLTFVDATDTVPQTAYRTMINMLRQTDSDFAAGSVRTVVRGRKRRPSWSTLSHDLDRPALTLSDFPLALLDTSATNKIFRKDFWDTVVGGFPTLMVNDAPTVVGAMLQAKQFDLLQTISYVQRQRLAPGQLLPDPLTASELQGRLESSWAIWEQLKATGNSTIAGTWLGGWIDGDLGDLATDAHRADAGYRDQLQDAAQQCLALADDTAWRQVRVDRKLRLRLLADGRWTDVEQLVHHTVLYGSIPPTTVRDGRVYAVAAELPSSAGAPLASLELSESQTALSGCVEHITWHDQRLEIQGWAFIRGVDLSTETPDISAAIVEPDTGNSFPCEVTQLNKPAANEWAGFRYQDIAAGGFIVGIDTQHIDCIAGLWQLQLTARAHGVERTGPLQAVAPGGAGHLMWGRDLRPRRHLSRRPKAGSSAWLRGACPSGTGASLAAQH